MADPAIPEIAAKVGLVYFAEAWRRSYFVPRRDGQSIECAACGRHFIASANLVTLAASKFGGAMRERIFNDAQAIGWTPTRHLGGIRLVICPTCAERLA